MLEVTSGIRERLWGWVLGEVRELLLVKLVLWVVQLEEVLLVLVLLLLVLLEQVAMGLGMLKVMLLLVVLMVWMLQREIEFGLELIDF